MVTESSQQGLYVKHRPRAGSSQAEAKAPINRSCEAKNRTAGGRAGWQQETPGNAASERGAQSPEGRGPVKTGKRPLPRTRSCLERSCTSAEVRPSQESRNYGLSAPFLMLPVNPITWASAKGVPDTCGQRTLTETQVLRLPFSNNSILSLKSRNWSSLGDRVPQGSWEVMKKRGEA